MQKVHAKKMRSQDARSAMTTLEGVALDAVVGGATAIEYAATAIEYGATAIEYSATAIEYGRSLSLARPLAKLTFTLK